MKISQKTLLILLTLILLLSFLLVGCTPDDGEQTPSQTLPVPDSQSVSDVGESGAQNTEAFVPGTGSAQTPDEETEEVGLEIISEYTVEVGDNLGVGGN